MAAETGRQQMSGKMVGLQNGGYGSSQRDGDGAGEGCCRMRQ